MSKQDEAKAARELKVFKLFAQLTQLPVKTIRQEAPDIFCVLKSGEKATYELVTLDSAQSSQTWGDFHSTTTAWSRALKALPADRRRLYFENFKHASIHVQYGVRPDRAERGGRMAQIIDKLLEQPAGFVGSVHCGQDTVHVEKKPGRPYGDGPTMLDSMTPTPQAVVWDRIRDKVEKHYRIAGQFELIAYSYRDTLFHQAPEDAEPPVVDIMDWLRGSAFSRLWIVEWHYKRIYRRFERPV